MLLDSDNHRGQTFVCPIEESLYLSRVIARRRRPELVSAGLARYHVRFHSQATVHVNR